MHLITYDSKYDSKLKIIHEIQSLINGMLICVYKDKKLYTIKKTFLDVYNELLLKYERIVVIKNDNDIIINDFTIKRTTKLGKEMLMTWYVGKTNERNIFSAFWIDSPLVESLYE